MKIYSLVIGFAIAVAKTAAFFLSVKHRKPPSYTLVAATQKPTAAALDKDVNVRTIQAQWAEQEAHLKQMENALRNDPDLENILEQENNVVNKEFMEQEYHRHDSFLKEVEHSILTDPDLAGVVEVNDSKQANDINSGYMEREAHKHDSFLNEIEYSIENDPDLL